MDMSNLRWILVILGVVIIAGVFLFGNPDKKRKPRASRKRVHAERVRREPALDSEQGDDDVNDDPNYDSRQTELNIDSSHEPDQRLEPTFDSPDDELIEITPKTFRMRKKLLNETDRKRKRIAAHN